MMGDQAVDYLRRIYESGRTTISGDHVFVESGVHVVGDFVSSVSGNIVQISGQHVFVESGVHVVADVVTSVDSGLHVWISGQHIYVESGAHVVGDFSATTNISGQPVTISGDHVYVESGAAVITQPGIQVSGTVAISGDLSANISGQWVEAHILSGDVTIISGTVGAQVSGIVGVSGKVSILSGKVSVSSGEVHILSGQVTVESGLHVVADIAESGIGVQIQSGASVIAESGLGVQVESGAAVVTQPGIQISGAVIVSGDLSANISGQWVEAHILSGAVTLAGTRVSGAVQVSGTVAVSGLVGVQSGEVHILSGIVTVESGVFFSSGLFVNAHEIAPTAAVGPAVLQINNAATQITAAAVESFAIKNLGNVKTSYTAGPTSGSYTPSSGTTVWLGHSTVNSGIGMIMDSGEVITANVDNMNRFYAWSQTSGTQVALVGVNV